MNSAPTVFHLITTINRGGAENHLVDLIRGQRKKGLKIIVGYLKGDGYWTKELEKLGVKVYPLNISFYGDIKPLLKLKEILLADKPQILHCHLPPAEIYGHLAKTLIGSKCGSIVEIVSKHNEEPFYPGPFSKILGHAINKNVNAIIAISKSVADYISKDLKLPRSKFHTVYYGIDTLPYSLVSKEEINELKQKFSIPNDCLIYGTVGRLVPQKDHETLIKSYSHFLKNNPSLPTRLLIVGQGPLQNSLMALASRLNISENIIWMGYRTDIPKIMNLIDVFILTSKYEGFGLVLLEAMAASKPVLATEVTAIPEVIEPSKTGFLFKSGDYLTLSNYMKEMESTDLRKKMGNEGHLRAKSKFNLEPMIENTISLYKQQLSSIKN